MMNSKDLNLDKMTRTEMRAALRKATPELLLKISENLDKLQSLHREELKLIQKMSNLVGGRLRQISTFKRELEYIKTVKGINSSSGE